MGTRVPKSAVGTLFRGDSEAIESSQAIGLQDMTEGGVSSADRQTDAQRRKATPLRPHSPRVGTACSPAPLCDHPHHVLRGSEVLSSVGVWGLEPAYVCSESRAPTPHGALPGRGAHPVPPDRRASRWGAGGSGCQRHQLLQGEETGGWWAQWTETRQEDPSLYGTAKRRNSNLLILLYFFIF